MSCFIRFTNSFANIHVGYDKTFKDGNRDLENLLLNSKDEYLISPVGRVYQYSDWGVDLLSLLVERVSGVSYEECVENNIFKPLQMVYAVINVTIRESVIQ